VPPDVGRFSPPTNSIIFPSLLIRPAKTEDAAVIAAIYNQSILAGDCTMDQAPRSPADISAWISHFNKRETILLLELDQQVLGWGIIKQYSDRPGYRFCCETSVYVRRAKVGKGYGSYLQEALLKKCSIFGYHHVVAKIWANNPGSISMHKRFGFKIVGTQTEIGYADGKWVDVVIMQCIVE